jgi:hypothetical protein
LSEHLELPTALVTEPGRLGSGRVAERTVRHTAQRWEIEVADTTRLVFGDRACRSVPLPWRKPTAAEAHPCGCSAWRAEMPGNPAAPAVRFLRRGEPNRL